MTDAELIDHLGGPAALCDKLGYKRDGGVQRIQNWKTRGIPSAVKVEHPDLFLRNHGAAPPPAGVSADRQLETRDAA